MNDARPDQDAGRLAANIIAARADGGRIAGNIVRFVRLLRAAGLPIGPERTVLATQAVLAAGIDNARAFYWALHAALVSRRAEHAVFDQAFHVFWRDPGLLQQMLALMLPRNDRRPPTGDRELARRLSEALLRCQRPGAPWVDGGIDIDARGSWSDGETWRNKDFEQMSADELRRARAAVRTMTLPLREIRTRRYRRAAAGERLDLRHMLRIAASRGPDHLLPRFKQRRWRRPPLVVLCDISGSMDVYARLFLHFLHALTNERDRVHAFLFGTRLTNVTRLLANRDADAAIARVGRQVSDWAGGTRIGASLAAFNRLWARRVLGQNALVLLVTDGLDREDGEEIARAARRLRTSCRRLVWLNPLMRYDGYAPLAAGARELARHVSEMRPCHNLTSLEALATALCARPGRSVGESGQTTRRWQNTGSLLTLGFFA